MGPSLPFTDVLGVREMKEHSKGEGVKQMEIKRMAELENQGKSFQWERNVQLCRILLLRNQKRRRRRKDYWREKLSRNQIHELGQKLGMPGLRKNKTAIQKRQLKE